MAQTSYTNEGSPSLHTLFFRKLLTMVTHGWTDEGGYMESGFYPINDDVLVRLSDSLNTIWSNSPAEFPNKLWYSNTECDSIDQQLVIQFNTFVETHYFLTILNQDGF